MNKFRFHIFLILCLSCSTLKAQEQKLITGNFTGIRFPQFVREVETQTSYRIFYDSAETDSIVINLNANQLTIQQVFDIVFKNTNIHYAIGTGNDVFVTKQYSIQTALPKNFFDPGKSNDSTGMLTFAPEETVTKSNLKISPDNKLYDIG